MSVRKQTAKRKAHAQMDFFYEKIVDNFAGSGGASVGIEMATGRPVDVAINHDPDAILLHKTNHPHTVHYQEDVFNIDPYEVAGGHPIGLAWFSPTCTHFSKAKGSPLVDRHIRGLAWVTIRWAMTVRPRGIMLENVEEFQTWGPLMPNPKGEGYVPDPARAGETFRAFVQMLTTGCKEKNDAFYEACEFLQLDSDGAEAKRLLDGLGYDLEYRELVAADYGAPTTRKRFFLIARCDGRPIVWPEPTHAPADSEAVKRGEKKPWRSAAEIIDWTKPIPSIFESKEDIKAKYGLRVQRPLRPNTMRRVARGMDKFVIKAAQPFIIPRGYGERDGQQPRVHDINAPLPTVVATAKHAVVVPNLVNVCHEGEFRGQSAEAPLPTILAKNSHGVVASYLAHYHTEQSEMVRGQELDKPLATIDTSNRHALVAASLTQYYGGDFHGADVRPPLNTVTTHDRMALQAVSLTEFYGNSKNGASITEPIHTVTAQSQHQGIQAAHLAKFYGGVDGVGMDKPLPTVTTVDHNALVATRVEKVTPGVDLHHWPEVRALLNEYCGYHLADDEILLLCIGGEWYFISDVGLRMLNPVELHAAHAFPPDYIIDHDYMGNKYTASKQVARVGNSVPPPFATALVKANFPEWCKHPVTTMAELEHQVAV